MVYHFLLLINYGYIDKMKNQYKISFIVSISVIIIYALTAMTPSKKTVIKILDKDKATCSYYKDKSKISYYLSDGTTIYNTDVDSCIKLKNKNKVDSIIIIDIGKKMDTAIVNAIGDDNWYGEVKDNFKLDKLKY